MRVEGYGIRIVGTDDLFWGPDATRKFKPWPEQARRFDTVEEAEQRRTAIAFINDHRNRLFPHLDPLPTDLELVRVVTKVISLDTKEPPPC